LETEDALHLAAKFGFTPRNSGLFVASVVVFGDTRVDGSVHQRPSDETRLGGSGSSLEGDEVNSISVLENSGVTSQNQSALGRIPSDVHRNGKLEVELVFSESVSLFDHDSSTIDVAGSSFELIELKKREDEHGLLTGIVERNVVDAVALSVVDAERTAAPVALSDTGASRSVIDLANSNIREAELVVEVPAARVRVFTLSLSALGFARDDVLGSTTAVDPLTSHVLNTLHQGSHSTAVSVAIILPSGDDIGAVLSLDHGVVRIDKSVQA
jgi:hypothetical protein